MSTNTSASPETEVDRSGGEPVIIKVTWTTAELRALSYFDLAADLFRMVVRTVNTTTPGTYDDIGPSAVPLYCYSGIPGQGNVLYHYDPSPARVQAWSVLETPAVSSNVWVNAPLYQYVKAYLPKLQEGIYHVFLQRKHDGDPDYADFGLPVQVWCQNSMRFEDVYALKRNFTDDVYLTGPQSVLDGGV